MRPTPPKPDVELLVASGCAHCPGVLAALSHLLEQGLIGRLEVVNVSLHPEVAQVRGIRSVPWTRIGPFSLQGSYPASALREWAVRAADNRGMAEYFGELLQEQRLDEALTLVRRDPSQLATLVEMIGDLETPMGVRIGIGALFEDLAENGELAPALPHLARLAGAGQAPVRADAAYYLGLVGAAAYDALRPLLQDSDAEVREIAAEGLQGA